MNTEDFKAFQVKAVEVITGGRGTKQCERCGKTLGRYRIRVHGKGKTAFTAYLCGDECWPVVNETAIY